MQRRNVLGLGLGLGGTLVAAPALAQDRTTLTLVTDRPAAAERLAARISTVSAGTLSLDVQPAPPTDRSSFLSRVGSGDVDMYMGTEEAFLDVHPAFGLFAAMPGGMSASEMEGWMSSSDGRIMWDDMSAEHGVRAFMVGCDGPQPIWSKAPLTGPDALKGAAIGTTGLGRLLWREMGATEVVEIYSSSDVSGLDAFEGLTTGQMRSAGLLEQFPHMTAPSVARPMSGRSVGISLARLDTLSEGDRALLELCITAEHSLSRIKAMHDGVKDVMSGEITLHEMPADIWAAQTEAASAVMATILETNDIGADAADAYLYFLSDVAGWSALGEAAFTQGRNRELSL